MTFSHDGRCLWVLELRPIVAMIFINTVIGGTAGVVMAAYETA